MQDRRTYVDYEAFGAVGDGVTDDFAAIRAAHAYANEHDLRVVTDPTRAYYIGSEPLTACIQTDTDWSTTRFIIDDRGIAPEQREPHVFHVQSRHRPIALDGVSSIAKNQRHIDAAPPRNCLAVATWEAKRQFMRVGLNVTEGGFAQTDCFVLDRTGTILTPVIWDFDALTSLVAYPIDERVLTIRGGRFTTIANRAQSAYTYYGRGLLVTRSNVNIEGLTHDVEGELDHGAPYHGFARVEDCAYVNFTDCHFTGRRMYKTIGRAGEPVWMGSYDISLYRSIGISFVRCKQDNICDMTLWGVFTSNYCKDILVDRCVFSRVDAHMSVTNYTIRDSVIGWQGLKAIGHGRMLVENVTVFSSEVVQLRADYGSAWEGDLVIRDVTWYPVWFDEWKTHGRPAVITGMNTGDHDFGYECTHPERITIENLRVMDAELDGEGYEGAAILQWDDGYCNSGVQDYAQPAPGDHPYVHARELRLRGLSTQSGKGYAIWSAYPVNGYARDAIDETDEAGGANFHAFIEDVDALSIEAPEACDAAYGNDHRLVPRIEVRRVGRLTVRPGACPMQVLRG